MAVESLLDYLAELYHHGQYLQAYALGQQLGPLERWPGPEGRVLAGRLAGNLGAQRLARVIHRRAFREFPDHPQVRYYYALAILSRRGPWAAWNLLRNLGEPPADDRDLRADWFALRAHVLAALRDFENSEPWIDRALDCAPERPWIWLERSVVLEAEDRTEEALVCARKALTLRPWYRPAVQHVAYRLVQLNRDDEALDLLGEATRQIESGDVLAQLATLQTELQQFAVARANFLRVPQLQPLLARDRLRRKWLNARLADAAYYCGDHEEAARRARLVGLPFYDKLADRLAAPPADARRVLLPVSFVLQHHMTCSPATLSALAAYWQRPVDHLQVAETICYDGTPSHSERRWAEENGFVAPEFRVTWESAVALLDRGVPFTLTTVDPGSAHLQAVIGYDAFRRSLLVRDPSERHFGEFLADEMLKHYDSTGPRGMAMVPADRATLLDGLDLPEQPFYDRAYRVELALERHDRAAAHALHDELCALDPNHRLTLRARSTLANYDSDTATLLRCTEQLLAQFPKDANLNMVKLNALQESGRREDRLALLKTICAQPDSDPLFWTRYAVELAQDGRESALAERWLLRGLRARPGDARTYDILASLRWRRQEIDGPLELYRIAACLDDKNESYARDYFLAARHARRTSEALRFLEDRFRRFGAKSSQPARTLCWALEVLDQSGRSFETLEQAIKLRPNDQDLLLHAADAYGRINRVERSRELLDAARDRSHPTSWLRAAAALATYRGDYRAALASWQQVLAAEPLARDAHESVAILLADLDGTAAAQSHLAEVVARFPYSLPLRTLQVAWLRDDPPAAETSLRELLELHPTDAWARRELAIALVRQQRYEEAIEECDLADRLEPHTPVVQQIRGQVCQLLGKPDAARVEFREAIRLSVDYEPAIEALLELCDSKADRQEQLEFIHDEIKRQVIFGEGLLTYRSYAQGTLDPDTLLANLQKALSARPDLWHAWSAVIQQLVLMERWDEALARAREAVERFPLLPRMWLDLAAVARARQDEPAEIEALEQALVINPSWSESARQLAAVRERRGEWDAAQAVYERVIAREPRDPRNHGGLADVLWQKGEFEAAIACVERAVRCEPAYDLGWDRLRQWCAERSQPERAVARARELTESRPNEQRSWLVLAEMLDRPEQRTECFAALDRAVAISPYNTRPYDLRAMYLARDGRFDEALAACRPAIFGEDWPIELQTRGADLHWQRGARDEAVMAMRRVVAQDADFAPAWSRLSDWYCELGRGEEAVAAAKELVRLNPLLGMSWGYLADSELRAGERAAAKRDFQRALSLTPDYLFAATSLFDLFLADEEFDAAGAMIDRAAPLAPPDWTAGSRVRLACARDDRPAALAAFAALVDCLTANGPFVDSAVATLVERNWDGDALPALAARLDRDPTPAHVGAWAKLSVHQGKEREAERRLMQLPAASDVWRTAVSDFLFACLNNGRTNVVRDFIHRHGDALRADDVTWTEVAIALHGALDFAAVVKWQRDWEVRVGSSQTVTPRGLIALVESLFELNRLNDAAQVAARAVTLPPDATTPLHRLWWAAEAAATGDGSAALERLADVSAESFDAHYAELFRLTHATATWLTQPPDGASYSEARRVLRDLWREMPTSRSRRVLRRLYRRFSRSLARYHRRPLAAAWESWCGVWT